MPIFHLKDNQGRILFQYKGDRCLLSRYPDLDTETKQELAEFFVEMTDKSLAEVKDFLNYKSKIQELCS